MCRTSCFGSNNLLAYIITKDDLAVWHFSVSSFLAWMRAVIDWGLHKHIYIYIYMYMYIRTYIHTYVHTYIHTYIHTHMLHIYIYIYIYIYREREICIYVLIYIERERETYRKGTETTCLVGTDAPGGTTVRAKESTRA